MQSKALLAKLVVRGLLPGRESWKAFLRHAPLQCVPHQSHCWQKWHPSYRWIFSDAPLTLPQSPFMLALYLSNDLLPVDLFAEALSCWMNMSVSPLFGIHFVLDIEGRRLGEQTHIDWGFWDRGPASSFGQWQESRCIDADILQSSCLVYAEMFRLAFWR